MNYKTTAEQIIEKIGGQENIKAVTHCATRLRFNLMDDTKANTEEVKAIDGVVGVSNKGGQYQIIIGPAVNRVYDEVVALTPTRDQNSTTTTNNTQDEKKKGVVNTIFDTLSGIFVQIIPAIMAAGMISAVMSLISSFGWVSTDSPTYMTLSAVQSAVFYFLPVLTGYATAKKLGMTPALGIALGAVLCYSAFDGAEGLSLFGIAVPTVTYNSTVFPVILGVTLMSFVEKYLTKWVTPVLKSIIVPAVTLLIGVCATLLILGPLGGWLGQALYVLVTFLSEKAGWFAPALIALIYPIMVFTGMHYSLITITIVSLSTLGYDPLLMVAGFVGNFAEAGASFGTLFSAKNENEKSTALGAGISALMGITEPALFGITLPNRKTLAAVMLGGFCGALFAGLTGVVSFNFVGGLPSLPLFIDPANPMNLVFAVISILISFAVTCALTIILNKGWKRARKNG